MARLNSGVIKQGTMNSIAIASDHAGYEYKEAIKSHLEAKGYLVADFGTHSTEPVDYPYFIRLAATSVAKGENSLWHYCWWERERSDCG